MLYHGNISILFPGKIFNKIYNKPTDNIYLNNKGGKFMTKNMTELKLDIYKLYLHTSVVKYLYVDDFGSYTPCNMILCRYLKKKLKLNVNLTSVSIEGYCNSPCK